MKADYGRAFALLNQLAFTRISGSKEEIKAANILMDTIKEAGFAPHLEAFEVEDETVLKATFEVTAPFKQSYAVTGYRCAGNTPKGGFTAPLAYIGEINDTALADVKGKIIIINGRMTAEAYEKTAKAAPAAFITMAGTMLDTDETADLDSRKLRPLLAQYGLMPAFNMNMKDALQFLKQGACEAHIELKTKPVKNTSHNVVVDITGTKHPDEIVVIGAHYDSVEFTQGVYDNAAGSASIMELFHFFAENPPARTLRFIWFGSEEQGLLGSKAYLKAHEAELEKIIFMVNMDVGAILFGKDMAAVSADKDLVPYINYVAKEVGFPIDVRHDIMSSDSSSFVEKGIPAMSFGRMGARGAEYMHTRYDHMDYQSPTALGNTTSFAGTVVERLVNSVAFPVPRTIPEDIATKTDTYFHKKPAKDKK